MGLGCKVIKDILSSFFEEMHEFLYALQRRSDLCIPRNEIARPRSQFPHSCVPILLQPNRHTKPWEYINRSRRYMNAGIGNVSAHFQFLGLFVPNFQYSAFAVRGSWCPNVYDLVQIPSQLLFFFLKKAVFRFLSSCTKMHGLGLIAACSLLKSFTQLYTVDSKASLIRYIIMCLGISCSGKG